jgi:hypothetical protein
VAMCGRNDVEARSQPSGGRDDPGWRSRTALTQSRTAVVLIAPLVLLAGLASHPYVAVVTDKAAVAAALTAHPTRWGWSHLTVAVGSGLVALAFLAVRSYLSEAGEQRWSRAALPFVLFGSTLFALLPAMEIAMLAATEAGADPQATQIALDPWFTPILVSAAIAFAVGASGFAMGIIRSRALTPGLTALVVSALAVLALTRFTPLGVSLYVAGVAGLVALWPLAHLMWRYPTPARGPSG